MSVPVRIRYLSSGLIFKFHFLDCHLDEEKQPLSGLLNPGFRNLFRKRVKIYRLFPLRCSRTGIQQKGYFQALSGLLQITAAVEARL